MISTVVPAGASIVATEFNEDSIVLARPKANAYIRLASADIEHLAFRDGTFDAAVATLVFCSVERPLVGFNELRRVLKRARTADLEPSLMLSSPYRRAVETAAVAAEVLAYKGETVRTRALVP